MFDDHDKFTRSEGDEIDVKEAVGQNDNVKKKKSRRQRAIGGRSERDTEREEKRQEYLRIADRFLEKRSGKTRFGELDGLHGLAFEGLVVYCVKHADDDGSLPGDCGED